MKRVLFVLITIFITLNWAASAQARIYIPIDQPADQKFPIAIADLERKGGSGKMAEKIPDVIRNDLKLSGYFLVIPPSGFKKMAKKEGNEENNINFSFWKSINANALVKGTVSKEEGKQVITIRLFDPFIGRMIMGKKYVTKTQNLREVAHRFSDEIMQALTGIPGVFNTRIAYSTVTKKGKELAMMDMDGFNNKALTKNRSINISPTWSPNGAELAFTSYVNGYPDLYTIKVGGKRINKITGGPGGKLTPSWSPAGNVIAMASSASSISNLYTMSPSGKLIRRLTNGTAIDISPSWSPDGNELVFASERAGGLHLFKMNSGGGNIRRLSFVGSQNEMPNWSPMGDKIAFSARIGSIYDIFIINTDGSNIQRLTVGTGRNEHPTFSPDGRFITFSSTRTGTPAIYIMRRDGSNQTKISEHSGILPTWGPRI